LSVINIAAPQENRFQFPDPEIKKLEDPKVKAFFSDVAQTPLAARARNRLAGKHAGSHLLRKVKSGMRRLRSSHAQDHARVFPRLSAISRHDQRPKENGVWSGLMEAFIG
jgi:hypothetical protein